MLQFVDLIFVPRRISVVLFLFYDCCSDDSEAVLAHRQWKKAIIIVWRHAAQHKYVIAVCPRVEMNTLLHCIHYTI